MLARIWLQQLLLAVVCAAAFGNTLHNSFHLDDFYRVVDNPGIHQISRPWLHFVDPTTMSTLDRLLGFRPLLPLSLSINYALSGDSLVGYHITNILLQLLAASVVYFLVLQCLALLPQQQTLSAHAARANALCVALVFAIHPVSGIPVNYICARDQLMSQLFWSGSLLTYLRLRELGGSTRRWALCLALLSLSLLAKGDAVSAPLVVLAAELTLLRRDPRERRPWLHAIAFGVPVVGLFAFQHFVLGSSEVEHVVDEHALRSFAYPLTQARLHLFRYLPHVVWPFSMHQDPLVPLATRLTVRGMCGVLFVLASCATAWKLRKTQPLIAFCVFAYWIMLAPTSSFVPMLHLAVDYRPYPASPFLFLGLCYALQRARLPARPLLAVASVAWCAACSVYLNQTWRTEQTLWSYSVNHGGGALAHLNLAMSIDDPKVRGALLERALELEPGYVLAQVDLGLAMLELGEVEAGLRRLSLTAREQPNHAQAQYWYANALRRYGSAPDAYQVAAHAAELDLRNPDAVYQAVLAAQAAGEHEAALKWLELRQRLSPDEPALELSRGFSLQQLGRLSEAIRVYQRMLAADASHLQARFNLGCAFEEQKNYTAAAREFDHVLSLDPNRAAAHLHLAHCSTALGDQRLAELHQAAWNRERSGP